MNNIFKNAYFGKTYKTRDGRKVIYHCMKDNTHWLIFEEGAMYYYQNDGLYDDIKHIPNDLDIVSEWTTSDIDYTEMKKRASYEYSGYTKDKKFFMKGYELGFKYALELYGK